ncbi:MAG: hypothetical protein OCD00_15305 [Colwellia sp.]
MTKIKVVPLFLIFLSIFLISACAKNIAVNKNLQWDFDHQLQYKQTQLSKHKYLLEIIPNNKVNFERLSAFLLRHSYNLCQSYGYTIKLIKGIESFDDTFTSINLIFPSLTAKVECEKKERLNK